MAAKQKALSIKDKVEILKAVDKRASEYGAKGKIAKEFGIASSTLSTIIKDKKKILDAFEQSVFKPDRKRLRTAAYEDVEEALSEALASIDKVRRYIQAQEGTAQFFAGINALEKFMERQMLPSRQTMITDYFSFN